MCDSQEGGCRSQRSFLFFKMGAVTIWLYADRIDTPKKKKKLIKHNIEGEMARASA